jgi:cysteine-S-conjugate beta-lyase
MPINFDELVERRGTDSGKWQFYGEGILPMWVADMDFRSPEPVMRALHERIDHGVFGYGLDAPELKAAICARMERLHGWRIEPADILFLPGLVSGLNLICRAVGEVGDGVLVTTPVYPPFLSAPANQERLLHEAQLAVEQTGQLLHYTLDEDALAAAIQPNTRLFLLCNPHNPIGRAYTRAELQRLAEISLRHDLTICSDEIHCDLLLAGNRHLPIASLDPAIAQRTVTLLAPSKTFNLPGLGCSLAIVQNEQLRNQVKRAAAGLIPHVNILGLTAARAAYSEGEQWLAELLVYLTANRDFVLDFVQRHLPEVLTTVPEATYLAWLDCRALNLPHSPQRFFLEQAQVALADGAAFGRGGEGFVRLNFGCPRALLEQGLQQMAAAVRG